MQRCVSSTDQLRYWWIVESIKRGRIGWELEKLEWVWEIFDWQKHKVEMFAIDKNDSKNHDLTEKPPNGQKTQIQIKKVEIGRASISTKMKYLNALTRVDDQIIHTTVDTISPILFINWNTAKNIMDFAQAAMWEIGKCWRIVSTLLSIPGKLLRI